MNISRKQAWLIAAMVPVIVSPLWILFCRACGCTSTFVASASGAVLMLMLATATVTDLLWNRITNWTTYTAFAWAVGLNVVNELFPASREVLGGVGLVQSLLGGLFAFALFLAVFSITGGGAGDVKLMTCVGALLGPSASFDVAIYSFLVGGVVLFAYSAWIHGPGLLLGSMLRLAGSTFFPLWISPLSEEQKGLMKSPVPLGPFFAAGTMIHLFQDVIGPWF